MIIQLHAILGNRWSAIAGHLPQRTDNEIKNYWNTHLKKRLAHRGIDPVSHKTSSAGLALASSWRPLVSTQLTHTTQWDCALAEAEARLSKTSSIKLLSKESDTTPAATHPSAYFMRSWKTGVEDTLKPQFGPVKLESFSSVRINCSTPIPKPVSRPSKILQDWDSVLGPRHDLPNPFWQNSGALALTHALKQFSVGRMNSFRVEPAAPPQARSNSFGASGEAMSSSLAEIMFTGIDHQRSPDSTPGFPAAAEAARSDGFDLDDGVAPEDYFSPNSTLHGPDSDLTPSDSGSPCGSADESTSDYFEFALHQQHGFFHSFPPLPGGADHQDESPMSTIPDTFWHEDQHDSGRLQIHNVAPDGVVPESGGLELIIPMDFSTAEFSHQFESLCQEVEEEEPMQQDPAVCDNIP